MKTTVVTETTFSIQPDERTMKHILELKALNDKLTEALKCFNSAHASISSEKNRDEYPYPNVLKAIFDIEDNLNSSIIDASDAIGILCGYCLVEQANESANIK